MDHPRGLREQHPESTEESLTACRMEMSEILRVFDVRGQQLSISTASKQPQARGSSLEVSEIRQHMHGSTNVSPPTPASVIVSCPLSTAGSPPANRLLDIGFVSTIYIDDYLRPPDYRECDRQSSESRPLAPTPRSFPDENGSVKDPAPPALIGSDVIDGGPFGESGPPLSLPPRDTNRPLSRRSFPTPIEGL